VTIVQSAHRLSRQRANNLRGAACQFHRMCCSARSQSYGSRLGSATLVPLLVSIPKPLIFESRV